MNILIRYLLFCALFFVSCKDKPNEELYHETTTTRDTLPTPVKTAFCKEGIFEYRIEANGVVKAAQEITLYADGAGKAIKVNASAGKTIMAGDIIVEYDKKDLELKMERAELNKYNAEKEYESQIMSYEKLLSSNNNLNQDEIKKKLKISTGLAEALQEIKEIEYSLSKAYSRAPISGRMADVKIVYGQTIRQGEELLKLFSSSLTLECNVLESDLPQIRIGQEAEIYLISQTETKIQGRIVSINPLIDGNGMILIRISIPKTVSKTIYPGMHGNTVIKVPSKKSLLVPKEALVIRGSRSVVFTIEQTDQSNKQGIAKWNYVTAGRNNGELIEILDGLKNGDKVITSNNLQLAHDAVIQYNVEK
ncbi:MAG: efflux RND transporter periplasmic adaptor subunit [Candidatus Roizmanbacteria bacterium]